MGRHGEGFFRKLLFAQLFFSNYLFFKHTKRLNFNTGIFKRTSNLGPCGASLVYAAHLAFET